MKLIAIAPFLASLALARDVHLTTHSVSGKTANYVVKVNGDYVESHSNDEIARVDVYDLANAGCNFLSTHCSSDLTLSKDSNGPYYTVTPPCIIDEFQCQATCSLAGESCLKPEPQGGSDEFPCCDGLQCDYNDGLCH